MIKKAAVVGAGTMGASICAALILHDLPVILKDIDDKCVYAGLMKIDRILESRVKKGLSINDAERMRKLVEPTTDNQLLSEVDLVIEAVPEKLEIKRAVLAEIDQCLSPDAILASNTSSLSITQLAAFTKRPKNFVGLHFFNPAHLMKLVEVIPGLETSEETITNSLAFVRTLDKLPIRVEECASFLVNRLLGRYMNEALWCLEEGIATIEEIDQACQDFLMPIGPLALRDMNGADVGLSVARFNFQEYGERFRPAPILETMVKQNWLGQKSGQGFYLYDPQTKKRDGANPQLADLLACRPHSQNGHSHFFVERLFLPMINEAFLALQERICQKEDLDPALMAGLGMRKGPLKLAQDLGLANCLAKLEELFASHGERFRPAPLLKRYVWAGRNTA